MFKVSDVPDRRFRYPQRTIATALDLGNIPCPYSSTNFYFRPSGSILSDISWSARFQSAPEPYSPPPGKNLSFPPLNSHIYNLFIDYCIACRYFLRMPHLPPP